MKPPSLAAAGGCHGRSCKRAVALLGGAFVVAARCSFHATFVAPRGTASPRTCIRGVVSAPALAGTASSAATTSQSRTGGGLGWGFAGAVAAGLSWVAQATRRGKPVSPAPPVSTLGHASMTPCTSGLADQDVPIVAMCSDGGRRKRLGVGGKVCMLTGRKKKKWFYRTFSEHKNKRYWRPNVMWKKFWWEREKKFVRLFVSARAIRLVDWAGLEKAAKWAGLDLYAWSLPHWMPGSRQPLALKVGYTAKAKRDKMFWPDYEKNLNTQGKPLGEIMPEPIRPPGKPAPWDVWKKVKNRGPGTPPKDRVAKRLNVPKMVNQV